MSDDVPVEILNARLVVVVDGVERNRSILTPGARLVLTQLWRHATRGDRNPAPFAHPGTARIAQMAGLNEKTVREALRELRCWGAIEETIGINSNGEERHGWLLHPRLWDERKEVESVRRHPGKPTRRPGPTDPGPRQRDQGLKTANSPSDPGAGARQTRVQGPTDPPGRAPRRAPGERDVVQRAPVAADGADAPAAGAAHETVSKEEASAWCDRLDELDRQMDGANVDDATFDQLESDRNAAFLKVTSHSRSLRMWLVRHKDRLGERWRWLKRLCDLAAAEAVAEHCAAAGKPAIVEPEPAGEATGPTADVIDFASRRRATKAEREELAAMREAIANKCVEMMERNPEMVIGTALVVAVEVIGIDTKRLGELEVKCRS